VTSFTTLPLRLASLVGLVMSLGSILLGLFFLVNRFFPRFTLFGYYVGQNPGTTTIVILLMLMGSLLFLCIGILGEYLGIVMKEVKRRPVAIVQQQVGIAGPVLSSSLVVQDPVMDQMAASQG
jgi:dolichol-phosphate mannosyltransferase